MNIGFWLGASLAALLYAAAVSTIAMWIFSGLGRTQKRIIWAFTVAFVFCVGPLAFSSGPINARISIPLQALAFAPWLALQLVLLNRAKAKEAEATFV